MREAEGKRACGAALSWLREAPEGDSCAGKLRRKESALGFEERQRTKKNRHLSALTKKEC
jgi:hypothetical protein